MQSCSFIDRQQNLHSSLDKSSIARSVIAALNEKFYTQKHYARSDIDDAKVIAKSDDLHLEVSARCPHNKTIHLRMLKELYMQKLRCGQDTDWTIIKLTHCECGENNLNFNHFLSGFNLNFF